MNIEKLQVSFFQCGRKTNIFMTKYKIVLIIIISISILVTIFFTTPSDSKKVDHISDIASSTGGTLINKISINKISVFTKKWMWVNTKYVDGTSIAPKQKDKFSINFEPPRTLEITTDCNRVGSDYAVKDNTIEITQVFSTLMACENSQENEYTASLGEARKFYFTDGGSLVLELESERGKGEMVFK